MPRLVLLLALSTTALSAAVIRGTIVENLTGKPLSRVSVVLQPILGTRGTQATVRTNNFGGFEFPSLVAGAYLVKAARLGFFPFEYGQKLWNSAGQPIVLADDGSIFLNIRLMRYGGITGTILDENDIGVSGRDVVAYRNTQPPQLATHTTSDDRGVYRLSGLEPGAYLVRTAGVQDEQISYVPTFSKEVQQAEDARTVQVFMDEDATGMDIRPAQGKLLTITGGAEICLGEVTVTMASDMGRQTASGGFRFGSLPPGAYELYAECPAIPGVSRFQGAYTTVSLSRDTGVSMVLREVGPTTFDFGRTTPGPANSMQVLARRKDLAGVGPTGVLQLTNNSVLLGPGRWEVSFVPPPGYYVSGFYSAGFGSRGTRPDGWNEFLVTTGGSVRFTLSGGPGEMHGTVKYYGEPLVGAPVYLEAWDPDTRKRVTDLKVVRTDIHGVYRFQGLAPGTYRVLATFEYNMPDSASMELAGAKSVRVEARNDLQMDLDLYGIR